MKAFLGTYMITCLLVWIKFKNNLVLSGKDRNISQPESPRDETHCSAMWWDSMTTRQPTAHYHRSQQQELAIGFKLVLVGGDSQDARTIHGSSRSVMVHPSAFVLNSLRVIVVATPGWRNGPLLSARSDDDDDDDDNMQCTVHCWPISSCSLDRELLEYWRHLWCHAAGVLSIILSTMPYYIPYS